MFSLIITIISIALVAALALATIYYGGSAFESGASDAQAAKIVNQGQQLLGAAEMYYVDHRQWPLNVQELVAGGYLKTAPVALGETGAMPVAQAAASEWAMPVARQPVFVMDLDNAESCRAVNKRTVGMDGILSQAHTTLATQCYGTSAENLKAVVSKNGTALLAVDAADVAALPASVIVTDSVPSAGAATGWLPGYEPSVTTGSAADTPPQAESCGFSPVVQAPSAAASEVPGVSTYSTGSQSCRTGVMALEESTPGAMNFPIQGTSSFAVDGIRLSSPPVLVAGDARIRLDATRDIAEIPDQGDNTYNYCNTLNYLGLAGCTLVFDVDASGLTSAHTATVMVQLTGRAYTGLGGEDMHPEQSWTVPMTITIQPSADSGNGGGDSGGLIL